ncbi:histidinol-phosphate transaminase [Clostridium paridis]|uniref:Histidinol-phosphate transaminase n=1 Tax=Clostridium paridis TaxID=2803863 RepID=A0A937FGA2_9CLOT|nr:histidinol-phosphate transaminase [Clostridium paridis]MBL4932410.1 histidinol-phosphate transaminase [Clostridium paridis]
MKKIQAYTSMDTSKEIRLNANEISNNLYKDAIFSMTSILASTQFNRYPEDEALSIRKAYAKYAGVKEKNIIVGNGSDEMINLIISSTISQGKKLLTLDPDFSMFDFYTSVQGGEIVKVKIEDQGEINVKKFIETGKCENVSLIIFSNPNNPTGTVIAEKDIVKICESFSDIPIVVDEAYYEFYGESMIKYINKFNNLIVTRTLSKAWGLAAIRVGFLISNEEKINELLAYKVPYNVNTLSQTLGAVALEYINLLRENTNIIISEREKLLEELKELEVESSLDICFYPSKSNFIYGKTSHKDALVNGLKNKNILIRTFEDDSFRITVGSPQENKRLMDTLRKILVYEGDDGYDIKSL